MRREAVELSREGKRGRRQQEGLKAMYICRVVEVGVGRSLGG